MASSVVAPSLSVGADQSPPNVDSCQDTLDRLFDSLQNNWICPPLRTNMHTGVMAAATDALVEVDLISFFGQKQLGEYAYFDRTRFPPLPLEPAQVFTNADQSGMALKKHLIQLARDAGFSLIVKGRRPKKNLPSKQFPLDSTPPVCCVIFTCNRYVPYTGQDKSDGDPTTTKNYRDVSLHNNKVGNSRGIDGLKGARRRVTSKATDKLETCPFNFSVFFNTHGYYIRNNCATVEHCSHMKRLPEDIPIKLNHLTTAQQEQIGKLGNARTRAATSRNYFHANDGLLITPHQIRYAYRKYDAEGTYYYEGLDVGAPQAVEWLRTTNDISYCIWGAKPNASVHASMERKTAYIFSEDKFEDGSTDVCPMTELLQEVVEDYQADMESLQLSTDQSLFIACAWTTNRERRQFRLSPHVIKFDVTKGTNRENRPLFTVSIRTGYGSYITVVKAFLSNERTVTFRWMFSHALPTLLGAQWLRHVKLAITDGDSHEIEQLEEALSRYMPTCKRTRCAWHIITKGYSRHCGLENLVPRSHKRNYRRFALAIRSYCYTFVYPGYYETPEELRIAKCLLLAYVHSRPIRRFLSRDIRQAVHQFLVGYVFVHDKDMAFCHRKTIRHYDEATNSSHEGTNRGMKDHSAPVLPNGTVVQSLATLKLQSDIRIDEEMRMASSRVESTRLYEQLLPTAEHVTDICHDLIAKEWNSRNKYEVQSIRNPTTCCVCGWNVKLKKEEGEKDRQRLHPVWRRVRTVTLDPESNRLLCDCYMFERLGIPCRHQAAVIALICRNYNGFTHHDVSVIWWKKHIFFGWRGVSQNSENRQSLVDTCLQSLLATDAKGPRLPDDLDTESLNVSTCEASFFKTSAPEDSCLNFSKEKIMTALREYAVSKDTVLDKETSMHDVGMMSQESYIAPEDIRPEYGYKLPNFPMLDTADTDVNADSDGMFECSMEDGAINEEDSNCDYEEGDNHYHVDDSMEETADDIFGDQDDFTRDEELRKLSSERLQPRDYLSGIKSILSEQEDLFRASNYNNNAINLDSIYQEVTNILTNLTRDIRADMASRNNPAEYTSEWVSSNPENSRHRKRFRGSQLGIRQFSSDT